MTCMRAAANNHSIFPILRLIINPQKGMQCKMGERNLSPSPGLLVIV